MGMWVYKYYMYVMFMPLCFFDSFMSPKKNRHFKSPRLLGYLLILKCLAKAMQSVITPLRPIAPDKKCAQINITRIKLWDSH